MQSKPPKIINTSIKNVSQFRDWLLKNHKIKKECWILITKSKFQIEDVINYYDAVEQAICFGWIDSTYKSSSIPRVGYQRFSKRVKHSPWTELNRARARKMERLHKMHTSGWDLYLETSEFAFDQETMETLKANEEAYQNFIKFPLLYQKVRMDNIQRYKHDQKSYNEKLTKLIEFSRKNVMYGSWNDNGRLSDDE